MAVSIIFRVTCYVGGLWSHSATKSGKLEHDSIDCCLGYLHAKDNPNNNILWSWILQRKTGRVWKIVVLHLCSNNLCVHSLACHAISACAELLFLLLVTVQCTSIMRLSIMYRNQQSMCYFSSTAGRLLWLWKLIVQKMFVCAPQRTSPLYL